MLADEQQILDKITELAGTQATMNTGLAVMKNDVCYIKDSVDEQKETTKNLAKDVENLKTWRSWIVGAGSGVAVMVGWILSHLGKGTL